jgi:hypothetical protein
MLAAQDCLCARCCQEDELETVPLLQLAHYHGPVSNLVLPSGHEVRVTEFRAADDEDC